jgi:hypothetical protein
MIQTPHLTGGAGRLSRLRGSPSQVGLAVLSSRVGGTGLAGGPPRVTGLARGL